MSAYLEARIEELSARLEDTSRRLASVVLTGKVAEIDGNKIRVELGPEDPRTGKKFLGPWVQLQEMAGATASHFPVKVGDPVRLLSPNGEISAQSLAIRDSHTDDDPNPAEEQTDLVLAYGGSKIMMQSGKLILSGGGASVELSGGNIKTASGELTHNDKNIGATHHHGGVVKGAQETDDPV